MTLRKCRLRLSCDILWRALSSVLWERDECPFLYDHQAQVMAWRSSISLCESSVWAWDHDLWQIEWLIFNRFIETIIPTYCFKTPGVDHILQGLHVRYLPWRKVSSPLSATFQSWVQKPTCSQWQEDFSARREGQPTRLLNYQLAHPQVEAIKSSPLSTYEFDLGTSKGRTWDLSFDLA